MNSSYEKKDTPPSLKESALLTRFKLLLAFIMGLSIIGVLIIFLLWIDEYYAFDTPIIPVGPVFLNLTCLIPLVFLSYRYRLGRENKKFVYIENADRKFKKLCDASSFILILPFTASMSCIAFSIVRSPDYFPTYSLTYLIHSSQDLAYLLSFSVIPFLLSLAVQVLKNQSVPWFFNILTSHRSWYETKWFPGEITKSEDIGHSQTTVIHELKADNSIADELMKWTDMRDKGIVTEEEFQKVREKLLKKI